MSARQPLNYEITFARRAPLDAVVESEGRSPLSAGPPPEFGGDAVHWTPEHLLVSAAGLCFWTTLEFFVRRRAVPLLSFSCQARGRVEKTARGLAFTGVHLDVVAGTEPGREAELRELMEVAEKSCLIANSLSCPVEVAATVTTGAAAAVALGS